MKILIVSSLFPPKNTSGALRPYSWAKYWSQMGHEVDVLTSPTKYNEPALMTSLSFDTFQVWEIEFPRLYNCVEKLYYSHINTQSSFYKKNNIERNKKNGCNPILRFLRKLDVFRKSRGISRTARMPEISDLWGIPAIRWASSHGNWDLIISTFGPYINHIVAYTIKKRKLAEKWIADFRDLWVDDHIYPGIWPFRILEKWLERHLMTTADVITIISYPLAEVLQGKYGSKVHVIENGFDPDDLKRIDKKRILPKDGKTLVKYTGNIYPGKRDPSPLFSAISDLNKDPDFQFKLKNLEVIFFGKNLDTINSLINKYSVNSFVRCGGFVSREISLSLQCQADILLFLEWDHPSAEGVLTGKLFEYLWAGPLIWGVGINNTSQSAKLISENGFGVVFGKDTAKIKRHLVALLNGQTPRPSKSDNRTKILQTYHRKFLAERMLRLIPYNN